MILRFLLATAITLVGVSASAAPLAYECNIAAKGKSRGWLAEKMGFSIDQTGKVTVVDGYILHYGQDPMIAKVTKNTNETLKFRWALRNIRPSGNELIERMNHEAIFNKKTNKITIRVELVNWPGNRFSGKGTCKPLT